MWGSQTAVYESDFSADEDNWTGSETTLSGNTDSIEGEDDCLRVYASVTDGVHSIQRVNTLKVYKRSIVSVRFYIPATNTNVNGIKIGAPGTPTITSSATGSWTTISIEDIDTRVDIGRLYIYPTKDGAISYIGAGAVDDDLLYLKDITVTPAGATAAYLPENIQPVPGQWLDASSNKLHALMPAAGCTLMRPENEFEIRWTNTWAGTSEMQYIGGTNQAVLPEGNIRIEYITITCTATGVSITIGDGSDADRFVTSTALADYLDISSPTKRNHDGTNRDMTITPSGAYTGSITTTVVGKILD
jgi:hypothetical protein